MIILRILICLASSALIGWGFIWLMKYLENKGVIGETRYYCDGCGEANKAKPLISKGDAMPFATILYIIVAVTMIIQIWVWM